MDGEVSNEDGVISAAVVKKAVMNEAKYTEEPAEIKGAFGGKIISTMLPFAASKTFLPFTCIFSKEKPSTNSDETQRRED